MKAIARIDCNTVDGIDGAFSIACGACFFEAGMTYNLNLYSNVAWDANGELKPFIEAVVYGGTLDGYDRLNGVSFSFTSDFNNYFKIEE